MVFWANSELNCALVCLRLSTTKIKSRRANRASIGKIPKQRKSCRVLPVWYAQNWSVTSWSFTASTTLSRSTCPRSTFQTRTQWAKKSWLVALVSRIRPRKVSPCSYNCSSLSLLVTAKPPLRHQDHLFRTAAAFSIPLPRSLKARTSQRDVTISMMILLRKIKEAPQICSKTTAQLITT